MWVHAAEQVWLWLLALQRQSCRPCFILAALHVFIAAGRTAEVTNGCILLVSSIQSLHCDLCLAGLLQCEASAAKPASNPGSLSSSRGTQVNDRLSGSPDISMLSPELQQQWDVERNSHLGAIRVKPQSNRKVVWQCDKCPAGQPHIWTAVVGTRTRGTPCPYCNNTRVCLHNSLATIAPDVAQYWNDSKNEKSPEQVLAGSTAKAEWKCPACHFEWQAHIMGRTQNRSGCPKCSQANSVRQTQPTLFDAQPPCLAEWDYELNDAEDIYHDNITLGSEKLVHWICSCCPRGQPHRWTASPSRRIGSGSGCLVCAGRQACVCNSLASLFPVIAAEFDVDKNGFGPSDITAGSNKKVWWRNAKQGSWKQSPHVRTDKRKKLSSQQV